MNDLTGKITIVTGASKGIGAIARGVAAAMRRGRREASMHPAAYIEVTMLGFWPHALFTLFSSWPWRFAWRRPGRCRG